MNRRRFVSDLLGTGWAAIASAAAPPENDIEQVLVAFKCHLDVGFIDTQAAVIRKYFAVYYPQAIAIAGEMRAGGGGAQTPYMWTTGSWLLYRYLEQAAPADRKRMEEAIARDDIAWHALPFTWQTELLDHSTVSACLGFSKALDRRFGRTTTGAKMTDVPGHSRGLIAPLAENGVKLLDIGVNSASTPPDVPPVFVWKNASGASLIVIYHRTAYGGVVRIPGSKLAIAMEVRNDNSGPHTPAEIRKIYAGLRARFPNAKVRAANLTMIAEAVKPYEHSLPVVQQEIGDTWIYGVPSDPWKVARFRELLRLRRAWIASGKLTDGDQTDLALLAQASLCAEHTWGMDTKTWLDFDHYTPSALQQMLGQPKYRRVASSWVEKRADLDAGVATLPPPLRSEAEQRFQELRPVRPDTNRLSASDAAPVIDGPHFRIGLDPKTGAITKFVDKKNGRDWASAQNPLAEFAYQTLSQADYDRFLSSYITVKTDWAPKDFGKPNIAKFGAQSQTWGTELLGSYRGEDQNTELLIARLQVDAPAEATTTAFPKELWLTLALPKAEPAARITLAWFGKPANRLPEAIWLTFRPVAPETRGWTLKKVEEPVSPFDVVPGGGRNMHALSGGMTYRDARGTLAIETLDAPVVALGERSPLNFSKEQPDLSRGLHFSLFNNAWGTNYIQWFGEDMQFRFIVTS